MFSVNTISVVICLCAMVPLPESRRAYRPEKKSHNKVNWKVLIPMTEEEKEEIVECHNLFRNRVQPQAANMQKLSWSDEAEENAKIVASTCSDDHSSNDKRQVNGGLCGENLYFSTSKDTWKEAITEWEKECEDFTYGRGGNGHVVGHYTQVVWADTSKIGCARAKCDNMEFPYLYVCHYYPAGNNWKKLATPYELGPPCSKCEGSCENKLCVPSGKKYY